MLIGGLKKAAKVKEDLAHAAKVMELPEQYIQRVKEHSYKKGVRAGKLSQIPVILVSSLVSMAVGTQLPQLIRLYKSKNL